VIEIYKFRDEIGKVPFDEWIAGLKDKRAEKRIQIRIDRLALGLEGAWKSVGEGVRELRIPEGKGYRIYYAWDGNKLVILLCGGDKSTQSKDIEKAKYYWREYHGQ
jgi:putative addiction module killer protein